LKGGASTGRDGEAPNFDSPTLRGYIIGTHSLIYDDPIIIIMIIITQYSGKIITIIKIIQKFFNYFQKIYNTLVLPTFLCGLENWTLTASQRRRIEAAEMKLLRPLAGYTPFMTTKQMTTYAANYGLQAYWIR